MVEGEKAETEATLAEVKNLEAKTSVMTDVANETIEAENLVMKKSVVFLKTAAEKTVFQVMNVVLMK